MNNRSCQRGMPEWAAGLSERRDRKNDVDMMSNSFQPLPRAIAKAFGTFGVSMKPKRNVTRANVSPTGSMRTRSLVLTRGVSAVSMVRMTLFSCSTLVVLEAVQQRGRREFRIAGQKHGGARHNVRRLFS